MFFISRKQVIFILLPKINFQSINYLKIIYVSTQYSSTCHCHVISFFDHAIDRHSHHNNNHVLSPVNPTPPTVTSSTAYDFFQEIPNEQNVPFSLFLLKIPKPPQIKTTKETYQKGFLSFQKLLSLYFRYMNLGQFIYVTFEIIFTKRRVNNKVISVKKKD